MEPRLHRYLVPLFTLALGAGLSLAWGRGPSLLRRALVLVWVVYLLGSGRDRALQDAQELLLPEGIVELASWIAEDHPETQVRVSGYHPELVVLSGVPETIIQPMPRGEGGALSLEKLARERSAPSRQLLVAFDGDPLTNQLLENRERLSLELVRSFSDVSVYR